ncbi:sigma-E factor regulatory protein RseB domain-containing protein [Angustibacter sp. McL0619]|uniref:sigma-E factor regulatory protein RseB domain-containing protein n=1 Tax=Angustibacter sp. McL0619 TaxID=3415676 RepID=UPI003CF36BED
MNHLPSPFVYSVMSVVSGSARRRWAAVGACAVLTSLLATSGPRAVDLLSGPNGTAGQGPQELVRRALAVDVPYSASSQSRGTLGLPDIPGLGDVADLLGGTTRARVWWDSPERWRVQVLSPTGEQDTYGTYDGVVSWDYERHELATTVGEPGARLPRPDDLTAPAVAHRLLSAVGRADRVTGLGGSRVAGRLADGVRIEPADQVSTIGQADVWVDRASALPLRVQVVDRRGALALDTELDDVRLGAQHARDVTPPLALGAKHDVRTAPDLAATIDQRAPWLLPDTLAGLPATRSLLQGTASYGTGLVRFALLPLPGRTVRDVIANATSAGSPTSQVPGGTVAEVSTSLLDVVVAQGDDFRHGYLIAGLVGPDLLRSAAQELLASPPPRRLQ